MSLLYTVEQPIMLYNYHLHRISQINQINTVQKRLIITAASAQQTQHSCQLVNVLSFAITTHIYIYMGIFFKVPHLGKFQNEFGRMSFRKKLQMDQDLSFLEG